MDSIVLSHNRIQVYTEFAKTPNLSVLVLNNNKLKQLDKSILVLKKIKTLDLSNNDLSDIPSEVGLLPQLVRLSVEGNPLKSIRSSIKSAGSEVLKKYLR
jgi:Leucine-rich repeat (LRR) protein